jgi:hypothetical protein
LTPPLLLLDRTDAAPPREPDDKTRYNTRRADYRPGAVFGWLTNKGSDTGRPSSSDV